MKNAWKSILIIVVSAFVLFACMGSAMAHNYTLTEKHLPEPLAMKEIPNEPDPIEAIETYQIPEPSASEIPHVDFIFSPEECEEILIADGDPDSMIPLLRDFSFVRSQEIRTPTPAHPARALPLRLIVELISATPLQRCTVSVKVACTCGILNMDLYSLLNF